MVTRGVVRHICGDDLSRPFVFTFFSQAQGLHEVLGGLFRPQPGCELSACEILERADRVVAPVAHAQVVQEPDPRPVGHLSVNADSLEPDLVGPQTGLRERAYRQFAPAGMAPLASMLSTRTEDQAKAALEETGSKRKRKPVEDE